MFVKQTIPSKLQSYQNCKSEWRPNPELKETFWKQTKKMYEVLEINIKLKIK